MKPAPWIARVIIRFSPFQPLRKNYDYSTKLLRAAGACIALPALARAAEAVPPKRLLAIHVPLGMMPQFFFPMNGERSSPYLNLIETIASTS